MILRIHLNPRKILNYQIAYIIKLIKQVISLDSIIKTLNHTKYDQNYQIILNTLGTRIDIKTFKPTTAGNKLQNICVEV